jgi:hypothetical protein
VPLQLPYLVGGAVLGLAVVILGTALFVVQVLTRQTRLLRRLLSEAEAPVAPTPEEPGATTTAQLEWGRGPGQRQPRVRGPGRPMVPPAGAAC